VGCSTSATTTTTYASLPDFVDEARGNPPLTLWTGAAATVTASGTCRSASSTSQTSAAYDSQND
jgi:hypothetical protein